MSIGVVQTIKCCFGGVPKSAAIKQWIEGAVDRVTLIGILASRLANLHLLRCTEASSIPIPVLDQTYFQRCCALVAGATNIDDLDLCWTYNNLFKSIFNKAERETDDTRLVEALARQLTTNAKVYLKTQFLRRHQTWCKSVARRLVPDVDEMPKEAKTARNKQRWILVKLLFQCTVIDVKMKNDAIANTKQQCGDIWSDSIESGLLEAIDIFKRFVKVEARPVTYWRLVDTKQNHAYVRWLHYLMCGIEHYNSTCEQNGTKMAKTFALLPIRGLDRCYVSISSTALFKYLYRHRNDTDALTDINWNRLKDTKAAWKIFKGNMPAFWHLCFKIKEKRNLRFDLSIHTDGVGLSINYRNTGSAEANRILIKETNGVIELYDDETGTTKRFRPRVDTANARIIAVDPGRRDIYTSVEDIGEEKHRVRHYSGKKWMHMSGGNKAKKKRETWSKSSGKEYDKWLKAMPSCKVSTAEAMLQHLVHLSLRLSKCMEVNGCKKVRRLRFSNYVRRQKALERMCDEFLDDDRNANKKIVVVFGDAKFQSTGPVAKLRQKLRLRANVKMLDFDEFRTSKLANCCAHNEANREKDVDVYGPMNVLKEGATRRSRIYGVRICPNCRKIWNRDVNAALNMLNLFRYGQEKRGQRPYLFSRQCPKKKGGTKRKRVVKQKRKKKTKKKSDNNVAKADKNLAVRSPPVGCKTTVQNLVR